MLENGFEIIKDFLSENQLVSLGSDLQLFPLQGTKGGIRNIEKKSNKIYRYCHSEKVKALAKKYLGDSPSLVRAIYFNKTKANNWRVSWHQDRTVSVSSKFDLEGWCSWTIKDNTIHAQPPVDVLEKMVAIRVHLDDSTPDTGCLRVIPKSHRLGILTQTEIDKVVAGSESEDCIARRGSAIVMKPHLLHSSRKASTPSSRRVLHLEFSTYQLPHGITWA